MPIGVVTGAAAPVRRAVMHPRAARVRALETSAALRRETRLAAASLLRAQRRQARAERPLHNQIEAGAGACRVPNALLLLYMLSVVILRAFLESCGRLVCIYEPILDLLVDKV